MTTATFYHAGCTVCQDAERLVGRALDRSAYRLESVHLVQDKGRIAEAERAGVKSVPALVVDGKPYHINFGASIEDVKKS
jgi:glutaredoxin